MDVLGTGYPRRAVLGLRPADREDLAVGNHTMIYLFEIDVPDGS